MRLAYPDQEKERIIQDLNQALSEVSTLKGILIYCHRHHHAMEKTGSFNFNECTTQKGLHNHFYISGDSVLW